MQLLARLTLFLLLAISLSTFPHVTHAADNRNDGNTHDDRDGAEDEDNDEDGSEDDDDCYDSSPVLIKNGEFIWQDIDVALPGRPAIQLSRYYRSYDAREGIFGKGWTGRCEKALIRVLDYVSADGDEASALTEPQLKYIYRIDNGRKYEFVETSPNNFASPDGFNDKSLRLNSAGAPAIYKVDGSIEQYNLRGQLTEEIDRNGNRVTYTYSNGVLDRISDENGRFLSLTYNANGHVASVIDHTDRKWLYSYNVNGTLKSVTNPVGGVRQYEYIETARRASDHDYSMLSSIIDASGVTLISVNYSEIGMVESYTTGTNTYTYSKNRGFTYKTDSIGSRWAYATDESGKKTEEYSPVNTRTPESYVYDKDGNVVKFINYDGTEFERTYDEIGRVVSVTTPDGTSTISYVDDKSWPNEFNSVSGRKTLAVYDSNGNPISVTDPAGQSTTFRWNDNGDLLAITDALGNTVSRTVNSLGQTLTQTDKRGHTTEFGYDARGNLLAVTDTLGNTTEIAYDNLDRQTSVTNHLGQIIAYTYDAADRLLSMTDQFGNATAYDYDEHGRCSHHLHLP